MDAVNVERVFKNYKIFTKPADRLKELFYRRKKYHTDFWALSDVSFTVKKGTTFGVIGENGSGKSTLLQIIAGTLQATSGQVSLGGRVAALLELGAGFNPEFSGRENVFLNAAIMGLSTAEIEEKFPDIEQFAEIGEFINKPVKTYSSGMYVRLAFAVSIHVDPEILLVDESLSVGDVYFQQRCIRRLRQMKEGGKTILFVSHDMTAIKNLCETAVWLEHGKVREFGNPDEIVSHYLAEITKRKDPFTTLPVERGSLTPPADAIGSSNLIVHSLPNIDRRWGNGQAEILGVLLLDGEGFPCDSLTHGDPLNVRVSVKFNRSIPQPIVGILMRNRLGEDIAGMNTSAEGIVLPPTETSQIYTVDFRIQLPYLHPGNYYFSLAVANGTHLDYVICDWIDNAVLLAVKQRLPVYGYMRFDCQISLVHVSSQKSVV
jgi:ABC-type polysaccharide/polyol phosphate transport system ATPase subunit